MQTTRNHYGYTHWQFIECDNAAGYCNADNKAKRSNHTGGIMAGRGPVGPPTGQAV